MLAFCCMPVQMIVSASCALGYNELGWSLAESSDRSIENSYTRRLEREGLGEVPFVDVITKLRR